jgi:hypothetical protein
MAVHWDDLAGKTEVGTPRNNVFTSDETQAQAEFIFARKCPHVMP